MAPDRLDELKRLPKNAWPAYLARLPEADKQSILDALKSAEFANKYAHEPVGYIENELGETLWSKQKEIAEAVRDHERVVIAACHAPGKFFRIDTPILTPSGWEAIGDLQVEDEVFAQDGTITKVMGVYPQGKKDLYRIHFNDKTWVDAGLEHQWVVHQHYSGRKNTDRGPVSYWKTVTTADIIEYGGFEPVGKRRTEIPLVSPIEFPTQPTPMDPYVLGIFLGDGSHSQSLGRFSCNDEEILKEVARFYEITPRSGKCDYFALGAYKDLRAAGVHLSSVDQIKVPSSYLWNSPEVRLAVLRGLMDSDGTVGKDKSTVEFTSCSEHLADDVFFLVQSLGGIATKSVKTNTTYTYKGEKHSGRSAFRVRMNMPVNPFQLPRKALDWDHLYSKKKAGIKRLVARIEEIDPGEAVCIEVDHPLHTYVAKDFIVSHNSHLTARLVLWWIMSYPVGTAKVITTANNYRLVRNLLWPNIRKLHKANDLPGVTNQVEWIIGTEIVAFGFASRDEDPESVQGAHAPHMLIIVDEAAGISHALGSAFESLLSTGHVRILLLGNPPVDKEGTWFEDCYNSPNWHSISIPASTTPNWTGEETDMCKSCPSSVASHRIASHLISKRYANSLVEDYGEDSAMYMAKVLATFPHGVANKTIPISWIEAAAENKKPEPGKVVRLGVDVASDGGDEVVVARAIGNVVEIVHTSSGEVNANAVDVANNVMQQIWEAEKINDDLENPDPVVVKIDATGVGWGVVSNLETWGSEGKHKSIIVGVTFAEKAADTAKFGNQRAEMWWNARSLLAPVRPDKPESEGGEDTYRLQLKADKKSLTQLNFPNYRADSSGRIFIEKKSDMKRRGLNSPDRAEAIVLVLYEPPKSKKKRKGRLII